jgi:hypothetical protein
MTLRLGCDVPYFEDPDDIRTFARPRRRSADHIGFSEHVVEPARRYPAPSQRRPLARVTMLAFLAAVTTTIEVSSAMALVTLRPGAVAKQAAEVDLLSWAGCGSRSRRLEPRGAAGARRRSGDAGSSHRRDGAVAPAVVDRRRRHP